jgi:hypothetical protein
VAPIFLIVYFPECGHRKLSAVVKMGEGEIDEGEIGERERESESE